MLSVALSRSRQLFRERSRIGHAHPMIFECEPQTQRDTKAGVVFQQYFEARFVLHPSKQNKQKKHRKKQDKSAASCLSHMQHHAIL